MSLALVVFGIIIRRNRILTVIGHMPTRKLIVLQRCTVAHLNVSRQG